MFYCREVLATGRIIAEALRMDYAFLCEFEEIHSPLRDAMSQVPSQISCDDVASAYFLAGSHAVISRMLSVTAVLAAARIDRAAECTATPS